MRAPAILGILAATAAAEPLKPVVATFGSVTRVLPHGRLFTRGTQKILILTEASLGCGDQRMPPPPDYSIIAALGDERVSFIAFRTKTGSTMIAKGHIEVVPARDRATIGTIDVTGGGEAHGAFDLIVCPPDKGK
jgi:hypothetical protein